ncbi:MAG: TIGR01212 family radical SAM protein [Bacteroidales bacterium]
MNMLYNIKPEFSWGHGRRFNSYPDYFRKRFGTRMQKVSIDAGFTCPNRDGTKGSGGCTYCDNRAFNPSYCSASKSVTRQIEEGIEFHSKRYRRAGSYLAYFQAYSNTYAPVERLREIYSEALKNELVRGLIIGTRPDCVGNGVLDLLQELSKTCYVSVEYGIESCYDRTLARINRGHTFGEAVAALEKTCSMGINTGAHFIFGLPGEKHDDMMNEADIISGLPLTTVKFHQLQIIKGTRLEDEFKGNPSDFELFTWDEYLGFIIRFLEKLNPEIVVERFTGEAPPRFLANEPWSSRRTDQIMTLIEKKLEDLDTWQGKHYKS